MPIKTPQLQPVRLLPRTEPKPSRQTRQQFQNNYAEEAESHEIHVGRIRRDAVIGQEPPPAHEKPDAAADPTPTLPAPPADAPTLTTRIARACVRDEHTNLRTTRLAAIIARFCNLSLIHI